MLERADDSGLGLQRVRRAIAAHGGSADDSPIPCEMSDDDAARVAMLAEFFELSLEPPHYINAPGASCIRVNTLGGWLDVDYADEPTKTPYVQVSAPEPVDYESHRGDPQWDDAPTVAISYSFYSGSLSAEGGTYFLKKIGGIWRVIAGGSRWVS